MIGEILTGMNIVEKAGKFWTLIRGRQKKPKENVATRFVQLLESHGVHRNQIPRFIGHGLTLKDVQDDASLIAKLDETILEDTCTRFAIRREWLDGAELQVHPCHDFYKHPTTFSEFIDDLKTNNAEADLQGVLLSPTERGNAMDLLILQETIGAVGERPIYRYHLCNNWASTYWKARAYLAACVAIAWKHNIYVQGSDMPKMDIDKLAEGKTLLGWKGEGIWELTGPNTHPEDMALEPAAYLKGIDPEQGSYGIRSALELWLKLEEKGFMDAGFGEISEDPRLLFQQELGKYSSVKSVA